MATTLNAKKRETKQHSELKKLRDLGNIPGVIYGYKTENKSIFVSGIDFLKVIKEVGRNGVISLNVDGDKQNVVLSEFQEDSLKKELLHIDFKAVDLSAEMEADVKVELVGDSLGVKDGGVLQQAVHELTVSAKPNDIPDVIQVNVSSLQVGDTLTVSEIRNTFSYQIMQEDELTIASILAPRQEEEISTGEEQEPGMPDNVEGRETSPEGE
ncbi:50S ribosomal protein L25/general stress protein Ctc [Heyndrickxia oleronia]|uniref:50S ribosomal protein L25/general stress protein Ctc n=1 Tax=Heyndrickxia oleronia TaxID=38875 RepID=UPI00203BFC2F|nr:50S ribosomal protein L25/general stress protein Ctc [Heyndrickxia oleronia]MCM3240971.1 50S ribosomal protein L25/general stress protein Ctc [Heyndrickxia oleronia]